MNSIFRVQKHFTALDLLCSSAMNYRIISRERTAFHGHLDSVVPRDLLYLSLTLCFVTMHSGMLVARCSTSIADLLFMGNTFTLLRSDWVNSTASRKILDKQRCRVEVICVPSASHCGRRIFHETFQVVISAHWIKFALREPQSK